MYKPGKIALACSISLAALVILLGGLYYRRHRQPVDFLTTEADYFIADALAGHVHRPFASRSYVWAEHPRGRIELRTNNLGFREDSDTEVQKPANTVRVLVTGDSHTDGVVYNAESFPNLLEDKLNSQSNARRFEVINGGVGYYTFQNYAGFLTRHLDLKPDFFIVTVYLGNDFMEAIQLATRRGQIPEQSRSFWYRLRLWRAPAPMRSQAGNQIVYFDTYPEMKQKALEIARREIDDINQMCFQNKIRLMIVLLPTKLDVEEKPALDAKSSLRLSDAALDINQALKRSLINDLEQAKIDYLDMTDYMKNQSYELFWNQDFHLNDKGHRLVGEILLSKMSRTLIPSHPTANGPNPYQHLNLPSRKM